MFGEQKAKHYSEIRENNVAKKSNEVKTNTWMISWVMIVAHNVTRLLKKTDQCIKHNESPQICLLTLFCPNFCTLLRCFQGIALNYFPKLWSPAEESSSFCFHCEVLVDGASLRKKPAASLLWHWDRELITQKKNFKIHYEKSKVLIIKKYFEVKQIISVPWRFEPSTRMVWTIQGFLAPWNLEEK